MSCFILRFWKSIKLCRKLFSRAHISRNPAELLTNTKLFNEMKFMHIFLPTYSILRPMRWTHLQINDITSYVTHSVWNLVVHDFTLCRKSMYTWKHNSCSVSFFSLPTKMPIFYNLYFLAIFQFDVVTRQFWVWQLESFIKSKGAWEFRQSKVWNYLHLKWCSWRFS